MNQEIRNVTNSLNDFLQEKNKLYGDSALNPLNIFSKHVSKSNNPGTNGILIRMDDKLKRIKNSDVLRKNDIVDLSGYLILLMISEGYENFNDLID